MKSKVIGTMAMALLAVGCSQTPTASETKIVGGTKVSANDPITQSTVALLQPDGWQFCTGTLIDSTHVVTAGHCVAEYTDKSMFVYFGVDSHDSADDQDHTVEVKKAVHHPDYSEEAMNDPDEQAPNDISILTLTSAAPEGFSPVSIDSADDDLRTGETLTLAGYGLTAAKHGSSGVLRKVEVPLQDVDTQAKELEYGKGANGKGSCNGDSGGPAFVTRDGGLVLVGATSRGDESCKKAGIYTDVRQFTDWLSSEGASL